MPDALSEGIGSKPGVIVRYVNQFLEIAALSVESVVAFASSLVYRRGNNQRSVTHVSYMLFKCG